MKTLGTTALTACALGIAAVLAPLSAHADAESRFKASLDHPASVQTLKPASVDDAVGQIDCTWYADVMVRETGTDTPDPSDAILVPINPGAGKPACKPAPGAGAIKVKTEGFALVGRKGGFLIWDATDPNGAEPFMVMNTGGKVLFSDATSPTSGLYRAATLTGGVLHLVYTRGYNAPCSLLQDARGCWAKVTAARVVPPATPPLSLVSTACRAAYKGVGADDPSIIVFTTEVTIDAAGKSAVLSRGAMTCLPMP
jgi:hypothetical protein